MPHNAETLRRNPGLIFQRTFNLMFQKVNELIRALTPYPNPQPDVPPRTPKEARQLTRAEHTMDWLCGLARALAGDHLYRLEPFRTRVGAPLKPDFDQAEKAHINAFKRFTHPNANPAERSAHSRWLARLNYQRHVFAEQSTAIIAARLARRAGIKQDSDFWPAQLLEIDEPPIVWGIREREAASPFVIAYEAGSEPRIVPRDPANPAPHDPLPEADRTQLTRDPPKYHPRE